MARDDERRLRGEDHRSHEIDCERCEPLLSSYLLEELPAVEREQVGSHLGGCGKCRDELDLLRATAEALAKSPPPGDLSAGLEREPILRKARTFQRRPSPLWWASAAAAALVVAGTSLAIYRAGRWQMESGEGEVVRRDAVGAPEAPVFRGRARAELERTLESAPVQTAPEPAPAQPARPGTTGEGAEKAGVALTEADQRADASSWPILAKTNEDGAASVSESRALKLASRSGAATRFFGAGGGGAADRPVELKFDAGTGAQVAAGGAQGASPANGPAPTGQEARRRSEQDALLVERAAQDTRRLAQRQAPEAQLRAAAPALGVEAAKAEAGGGLVSREQSVVRSGGGAGPGAAPGGAPVPSPDMARKGLGFGRGVAVSPGAEKPAERAALEDQIAGGREAKSVEGLAKEFAKQPDGRWKERVDDVLTQLDRQPGETPDSMFFRYWSTNPFQEAAVQPLSTFSVDVDTASYTIFRSYLYNSGVLPPREAIRTEEFVNYFKTDYAPPPPPQKPDGEGSAFAIHVEMAPNPFAKDDEHRFLRIGIKGREVSKGQRRACSLVFVIDTSGSMRRENRLGLVKEGLRLLVNELDEGDTVGIVAFDRDARTILEPAPASEKERILSAIAALEPRQNTNVSAGLKSGYTMASAHRLRGGSNRVILLSDGVANTGNTDPQEMLREVQEEREKGIYLTCVGVGMGNLNDALLEELADKGDGQCRYVDRTEEAHRIFVESLTGTLEPIARNVKIQVEFDPAKVVRYRLLGYEKRDLPAAAFRDSKTKAAVVGAGHSVTAIYDLKPKGAVDGKIATVHLRLNTIDHGEAQEITREVLASDHRRGFAEASPRFQLAACVAQAAEVLRDSYWSRGVTLGQVLARLGTVAPLLKDDREVMELVALLTRADALLRARQSTEDDLTRTRTLDALKDNLYLRARLEDELRSHAGTDPAVAAAPERSPGDAERLRKLDDIRRQNEDLRHQLEALLPK